GRVQFGDYLGYLSFWPNENIQFNQPSAYIAAVIDSITGNADFPTSIRFAVAPNGSEGAVERVTINNAGRVGIGTTSPARTLHISATDAVRIPAGSNTQRTPLGVTNAIGDLRYNTEDSVENIEWYDVTGAWRRPVISALPTGFGTAGRFAQFKAGGLDTSDVLIQNGDKIGIGTASPDSVLTVNGSVRATRLALNTSGAQRLNINNYYRADQSTNGQNIWIGNGGQLLDVTGYYNGANTASNNIGIGNNSLLNLRAGRDNLALGIDAGRGIIYGTYNVALGALSLATRSDGSSANVAIGNFAMQFNGTKDNTSNVAIGSNALRYNRGGNYNVALGSAALTQNVPIPSNDSAGEDGGSNNFGLGFSSCFWNGKGIANVGIGSNSNYFNRNGSYNIAIGSSALAGGSSNADTIAKNNNVVIGTEAFQYLKGNGAGNADENVAIGHQAARTFSGGSNTTAAKQGIYIGALTKPSANTNTNEIVIGYNATGNGSNTTTIGNSSTTATYLPAGSLYINGTVSPARTLHVNGEARISDLITDAPTRIVGADADGDLGAITLGTGLSIASGTLNASGISSVYIPINIFAAGDTVKNTTAAKEFFLVHSGLNGYCIDSYTVKAIAGTGSADIQIDKNGTGGNLQSVSGTTVYTKDTNIALATGDYIRGQVFNSTGTLIGLGLTLEIKATCN
ncbi:MAG: hypothetical protein EBR82_63990, partial [Caulobacteraceae bacterium]|nr:hypothetical protein [Caulobacteraceae bacterium]